MIESEKKLMRCKIFNFVVVSLQAMAVRIKPAGKAGGPLLKFRFEAFVFHKTKDSLLLAHSVIL